MPKKSFLLWQDIFININFDWYKWFNKLYSYKIWRWNAFRIFSGIIITRREVVPWALAKLFEMINDWCFTAAPVLSKMYIIYCFVLIYSAIFAQRERNWKYWINIWSVVNFLAGFFQYVLYLHERVICVYIDGFCAIFYFILFGLMANSNL